MKEKEIISKVRIYDYEELSEAFTTNGAASSICVNAVSGEIVRVE
jgi:hypothetical protein